MRVTASNVAGSRRRRLAGDSDRRALDRQPGQHRGAHDLRHGPRRGDARRLARHVGRRRADRLSPTSGGAATPRCRLRGHRRTPRARALPPSAADPGPRSFAAGDRHERGRLRPPRARPAEPIAGPPRRLARRRRRSPATPARGETFDRRPGRLVRHRADRLRLPVAALRRRGHDCADIAGATGQTYALGGRRAATIRVRVTAANAAGQSGADPQATEIAAAAPPANTAQPTISGTARDGATLTADPGAWSGTQPIDYAYQWRRCDGAGASCADIPGATASTYALDGADVAATIRVKVLASNTVGSVGHRIPRHRWPPSHRPTTPHRRSPETPATARR